MNVSEQKLLDLLKTGDKKAFELIFTANYSKLCGYAFGLLRQYEVSEDIVKDLFLRIWEKRETLEINCSLPSYLVKSVHNSCLNYITRTRKLHISIEETDFHEELNNLTEINQPLSDIYFNELEAILEREVEKLPLRCKKIFKLSRYKGLSHREIAVKLGISENTVKVQIFNALKILRDCLKAFLSLLLIFSLSF